MFSVLQTSHLTEKVNLDDKQGIVNPEFSDIELETKGGDTEKITRFWRATTTNSYLGGTTSNHWLHFLLSKQLDTRNAS